VTLEEKLRIMRYTNEGKTFVKPLGEYRIVLFPSDNSIYRRITLNGKLVDIRKVTIENLETDNVIQKIMKDMPLEYSATPRIITNEISEEEQEDIPEDKSIRMPVKGPNGEVVWKKVRVNKVPRKKQFSNEVEWIIPNKT
jgi:hypothetical protein